MKKIATVVIMLLIVFISCNSANKKKLQEKLYYYNSGELRMKKFINTATETFEGPLYMWHKNGKYALKGNLVDGERHGEIIYFDEREMPNCYAYYDNGEKTGTWVYLKNNDTTKIAIFEKGALVSEEKKQ